MSIWLTLVDKLVIGKNQKITGRQLQPAKNLMNKCQYPEQKPSLRQHPKAS